ncbi:hypothetical protein [Marinobacter sp. SS21]|uniref:hypothetical protein n=1 Tax=Marinobacter sp. SS21 TaxID=2979460 RepID=UPI00232DE287|nr:hypothetical protein [Marinobacter sp. SS21]MDC0662738.1 hypothetical protein [Marinobacter sp. SS21]
MSVRLTTALTLTLILSACASSQTELVSVSLDRDSQAHYRKVLVLVISGDQQVRRTVEQSLANRIGKTGTETVVASQYITGDLEVLGVEELRQQALQVVLKTRADSVLVASLLRDEVREEYVAPQASQVAIPTVEPRFGPYVGYHYDTVVTPGYFTSQREVFVQTSLFDVDTGHVVWRARSKTINPSSLQQGVDDFSNVMTNRLWNDGMLAGGRQGASQR